MISLAGRFSPSGFSLGGDCCWHDGSFLGLREQLKHQSDHSQENAEPAANAGKQQPAAQKSEHPPVTQAGGPAPVSAFKTDCPIEDKGAAEKRCKESSEN